MTEEHKQKATVFGNSGLFPAQTMAQQPPVMTDYQQPYTQQNQEDMFQYAGYPNQDNQQYANIQQCQFVTGYPQAVPYQAATPYAPQYAAPDQTELANIAKAMAYNLSRAVAGSWQPPFENPVHRNQSTRAHEHASITKPATVANPGMRGPTQQQNTLNNRTTTHQQHKFSVLETTSGDETSVTEVDEERVYLDQAVVDYTKLRNPETTMRKTPINNTTIKSQALTQNQIQSQAVRSATIPKSVANQSVSFSAKNTDTIIHKVKYPVLY